MALPAGARERTNPVTESPEVLAREASYPYAANGGECAMKKVANDADRAIKALAARPLNLCRCEHNDTMHAGYVGDYAFAGCKCQQFVAADRRAARQRR